MSYEWLFRLNINLFIIIYTCCGAEEMASVPRRHTGAEIGNQKIWLIPPGLFPLYRRKCKFNYLFVHVSSPKVRQHNLNGNGETIYFLTWLFLPQIQAVTVEMKLVNKSQLFNHCVPIITVNNKWWGKSITFCGHFVFCHEIISAHFFGSLSIFDCLGGERGHGNTKGTIVWRACPLLHLPGRVHSQSVLISGPVPVFPLRDCLWRGKKISTPHSAIFTGLK